MPDPFYRFFFFSSFLVFVFGFAGHDGKRAGEAAIISGNDCTLNLREFGVGAGFGGISRVDEFEDVAVGLVVIVVEWVVEFGDDLSLAVGRGKFAKSVFTALTVAAWFYLDADKLGAEIIMCLNGTLDLKDGGT